MNPLFTYLTNASDALSLDGDEGTGRSAVSEASKVDVAVADVVLAEADDDIGVVDIVLLGGAESRCLIECDTDAIGAVARGAGGTGSLFNLMKLTGKIPFASGRPTTTPLYQPTHEREGHEDKLRNERESTDIDSNRMVTNRPVDCFCT
jgi:hypothetical protein